MIYIIVYAISIFFAYLCIKIDKSKHKILFYMFAFSSILIPALLAGFRSTSIGTDVEHYVIKDFKIALNVSDYRKFMSLGLAREPLYLTIVHIVARLNGNIHFLLFVFHFIFMICIFYGGYKHKDKISLPLLLLAIYLLFFNHSLNLIRQYLAIAIIFAGIKKIEEKKYFKFTFFVMIAFLFHKSTIIALTLPIIHFLVSSGSEKRKQMYRIIITILLVLVYAFFNQIITLLLNIGLVSNHFSFYINNQNGSGGELLTLIYIFEVFILLLFSKKYNEKIENFSFFKTNAIMHLILLQLSRHIYDGFRLSMVFNMINTYLLVQMPKIVKNNKSRMIANVVLVSFLLAYWFYTYVLKNFGETYPYIFMN